MNDRLHYVLEFLLDFGIASIVADQVRRQSARE
jgi:hypothetical protein